MIPIDELIEMWARVHGLSWWREACQCLRPPPPEDNEILSDEEEKR